MKATKEANLVQEMFVEENPIVSSNSELNKETRMALITPPKTMGTTVEEPTHDKSLWVFYPLTLLILILKVLYFHV